MLEILVCSIAGQFLAVDARVPVAEELHVGAGDVTERLVANDRDQIVDGAHPGMLPAAQLVGRLTPDLVGGDLPVFLQHLGDRDASFLDAAQQSVTDALVGAPVLVPWNGLNAG